MSHAPGLIHASAGAGKQGTRSESCFLVFLQEKERGKQGRKGRENEEKRSSSKENATKAHGRGHGGAATNKCHTATTTTRNGNIQRSDAGGAKPKPNNHANGRGGRATATPR